MRQGQTMVRAEPFWQLRRCQQELGVYATRRRGFLAGLLIAAIFAGSIDVALRFVADSQPQKEKPAFAKIQDRMISAAEPDTAKSLQTSQQSDSSPQVSVADVEAFSVSNIHPTVGFITHSAALPASTQQDSSASPTLVSSQLSAEPHGVPLPRRKPKRPTTKEVQPSTTEPKLIKQEQGDQEPKPMAFGSIGYNYNPQQ